LTKRVSISLLTALLTLATFSSAGENPTVKWKGFTEGLSEAKKTGKKVLVDVYTDWCGWCKKMDKDVYADNKVADYLSKNYVAIKLNAESKNTLTYHDKTMTQIEFSQGFGVTGYPCTLFLKDDGEPITKVPGYITADKFLDILRFLGEDHYLTTKWEDYLANKK
jgi:thioredoxin-related protein